MSAWVSEQCERVCCAQGEEPSKKYWGMHCGDAQSAYIENVTAFTRAHAELLLLFSPCGMDKPHELYQFTKTF